MKRPPQTKLYKLDALLARSFTVRQDAALLAEMLSLPIDDGRYPSIDLTAQQRREKTLEALTRTTRSAVTFQSGL